MEKNDFEFKYVAPTNEERKEIESIRKSYLQPAEKDQKLERLRKLDFKVKNIPTMIGLIFGVGGLLIFGLGLSMILEWSIIVWGIVVCAVSIVPMALAYPLCDKIGKKIKQKHTAEVLKLSEELLDNEE